MGKDPSADGGAGKDPCAGDGTVKDGGGTKLQGSFVAIITPFDGAGQVGLGGLREWVDFHAQQGTPALLIMGSIGEASMPWASFEDALACRRE